MKKQKKKDQKIEKPWTSDMEGPRVIYCATTTNIMDSR